MLDLLVTNAILPGQNTPADIACADGRIVEVRPHIMAQAAQTIDATGYLVTPPFVDSHFHMDATLSAGMPRRNESGTLLEGIRIWGELKPDLTPEGLKARALKLLRWSVAKGNLAIRTHVDTTDPSLMAVDVLLEVREEMKEFVDIQLVAFPQDGVLRAPRGVELLERALDKGVDVVGGIPHFERTMDQGRESVRVLCEIAARRGLMVDMHCDESDDPHSRHVESLAFETQRLGLGICPFLGVSKKVETALGMSAAVAFVLTIATIVTFLIQKYVLDAFGLGYLQTITFILVIAALVQMVEIILKKVSPALYQALGVFLPLITTNCCILGVAILVIQKDFNLLTGVVYAFSTALGFGLALVLFAGLREQMSLVRIPKGMEGTPIALITAGLLAMAFMGFSGVV